MKNIAKDLLKIASELDSAGMTAEAAAVDAVAEKLLVEAGVLDWAKSKAEKLKSMFGSRVDSVSEEEPLEPSKPAAAEVPGIYFGGKTYSSVADLQAVSGNERWLVLDDFIAALKASGKVPADKVRSLAYYANIDMKTWDNAVAAARDAGLVSA